MAVHSLQVDSVLSHDRVPKRNRHLKKLFLPSSFGEEETTTTQTDFFSSSSKVFPLQIGRDVDPHGLPT